jgi:hypothetical protein
LICFLLIKSSYEDYTEHFSVGLKRKPPQNLLSVILSRRFGDEYFLVAVYLVYARTWMLAMFHSWICKSYLYLGLVLAFMSGYGDVDDALG